MGVTPPFHGSNGRLGSRINRIRRNPEPRPSLANRVDDFGFGGLARGLGDDSLGVS